MKMTYREVLAIAKTLAKRDREKLRNEMDKTLSAPPQDIDGPHLGTESLTDEQFTAELTRRQDEAMRDPSVLIPWDVMKAEMLRDAGRADRNPQARKKRVPARGEVLS